MDMPVGANRPKISATDAAFAGFGLVRRNLGAFVVWTGLYLIYTLVAVAMQVWLMGPAMERMAALQTGSAKPSTEEALQALGGLGNLSLFYVAVLVTAVIYGAVMNAAVYRAVLRPGERGFAYLRLGADELRQAAVAFLVGLVVYGVYIAAVIVGVILAVAAAIGVAAMTGGKEGDFANSPAAIALAVVAGVVILLIVVVPLLLAIVRLSLAGPTTFMRRRVDVFGSWRLTKGRFWTLAGAYILAALVMMVLSVVFLTVVVIVALVAGVSLAGVSQTLMPDPKSMDSYVTPLRLIVSVVDAPLGALWFAVQAAIPATIYAQVVAARGDPGIDRSHAFGSPVAYPAPPPHSPPDAL